MRLSQLKTGEKGVIVKVLGHGGFRKRIIEMGFIKGKTVHVLLNAPLQDPVKYKLMGYEVSLRHDEAELIEVVAEGEYCQEAQQDMASPITETVCLSDELLQAKARRQRRTINVALIGNPNCGKTSLFNYASGAHARVGNYSGVTVDASVARASYEGYEFNLTDLPGTYSLSCYSPEELYVRKHLTVQRPDIVINVIDASNLERNLYLTTQLIDMNLRMVCALNMFDETERRGDQLNIDTLSTLFGIPMVPTSFKTGFNVDLLFHVIINMYEGADYIDDKGNINPEVAREIKEWHEKEANQRLKHGHIEDFAEGEQPVKNFFRHIHVNHGQYLERAIAHLQEPIKASPLLRTNYSTRYLAIKLLEHDSEAEQVVKGDENSQEIMMARDQAEQMIERDTHDDAETAIMDAKYAFIRGALTEAGFVVGVEHDTYRVSHAIDYILSNKYLGFPIFFLVLFVMFFVTFTLGQYPMDWMESGVEWLGGLFDGLMTQGSLKSLMVDGIIGGVGSVIVFLPQILILYFFISVMEDSGYMARAAFIMDKLMHKMGLHGKSFIPLIMGFGCNVPAVMATRTIESRRSRLITMMILPFMSCSARLPIYIMIVGTFFSMQYRPWIMISIYAIGIVVAVLMSKLLSSRVIKGEDTPFVMELPPYRWPTPKAIVRHTWDKGKEYLKKMGGVILVASIIVWALGYFPHNDSLNQQQQQEQSYIGQMGKAIEPVFVLQGFNWKLDVSLIAGVGAKEIVASTIGVLYADDSSYGDEDTFSEDNHKYTHLRQQMNKEGITPLVAFCYLLFVLLYFPCLATVVAIKNETGSWKWGLASALYTTAVAWIVSAAVFQIVSALSTCS